MNNSPRLIVLRSDKDKTWKTIVMETNRFNPKQWPGYRIYRSFPNTSLGKEQAQEYARYVEQGERELLKLNPGLL